MRNFLNKLSFVKNHPFTRDVATLQTASVAAKLISVGAVFIFARVLGPERYGFYSLVFALAGTINIFQEFGIGQSAINLLSRAKSRDDKHESVQIFKFFLTVSFFGLFIGLAGAFLSPFLSEIFYQDRYLGILAGIVVATTALTFFYPLSTTALQVGRRIKELAVLETSQRVIRDLIPVLLVLLGLGVFGIVVGQFAAMLIASVAGLFAYRWLTRTDSFFPGLRVFFSRKLNLKKAKSYFRFSFQIALGKNLIKLNSTVPLLFVGHFLPTNSSLGFYKIALAYVSLSVVFLDPISRLLNVQYPLTQVGGAGKLRRRFFQVTGMAVLISAVGSAFLLIAGPTAINLLFPEYQPSIKLLYPLALFPVLSGFGVSLGPLFRTLDKMNTAIVIQVITFILLVPAAYLLIQNLAIKGLIITTLVFTFLPNLLSFVYLAYFLKRYE